MHLVSFTKKAIKYHIAIIFISLIFSFFGCKNTIEIAAPYKPTLVVYGLLNPADSINYIRIQRGFLNKDGSAFEYVGNEDSIYPKHLKVELTVFKNGTFLEKIIAIPVLASSINMPKDSGLFHYTNHILYKISSKIYASGLNPAKETFEYQLRVEDSISKINVFSKCNTIGFLESLSPVSLQSGILDFDDKGFVFFRYREGMLAKAYDLKIRLWYNEYPTGQAQNTQKKYVDWDVFKDRTTISPDGFNVQLLSIPSQLFYENLNSKLEKNPNLTREAIDAELLYYGQSEELYTYIEVNKPSIGIIQKKPEYTNIDNGIGLFASRYITNIKQIPLSNLMKLKLKTSNYTAGLGF